MGLIIMKIKNRITSFFKIVGYKIIYGNKFKISISSVMYPLTHIVIEKSGKVVIGSNCFFNRNCSINSHSEVRVGNDTIFGENVCIYDHNHRFSIKKLIRTQGYKTSPIVIGNDCWIGSNVTILPGVTIGDHSIIGAGTVVRKSVPSNTIVKDNKVYDAYTRGE